MIPQNVVLLSNVSGTGATGAAVQWNGGIAALNVLGTLGGGNVQLQVLGPDNATWLNLGSSVSAAGCTAPVYVPAGLVRAVLAGATGATGVYASVQAVLN